MVKFQLFFKIYRMALVDSCMGGECLSTCMHRSEKIFVPIQKIYLQ